MTREQFLSGHPSLTNPRQQPTRYVMSCLDPNCFLNHSLSCLTPLHAIRKPKFHTALQDRFGITGLCYPSLPMDTSRFAFHQYSLSITCVLGWLRLACWAAQSREFCPKPLFNMTWCNITGGRGEASVTYQGPGLHYFFKAG